MPGQGGTAKSRFRLALVGSGSDPPPRPWLTCSVARIGTLRSERASECTEGDSTLGFNVASTDFRSHCEPAGAAIQQEAKAARRPFDSMTPTSATEYTFRFAGSDKAKALLEQARERGVRSRRRPMHVRERGGSTLLGDFDAGIRPCALLCPRREEHDRERSTPMPGA